MNKAVVVTKIKEPHLTKDTPVEVTAEGELHVVDGGAAAAPTTLGALTDKVTLSLKESLFDPAKVDTLLHSADTLERVVDAQVGVSDTLPEVAKPSSSIKVAPAARTLFQHRDYVKKVAPVAWEQVDWVTFESDQAWLARVTERRERLEVRLRNHQILEAHLSRRLVQPMADVYNLGLSAIQTHRSLGAALTPLSDLFSGAAQQAQETKKEIARAIKRRAPAEPAPAPAPAATPPVVGSTPPPVVK